MTTPPSTEDICRQIARAAAAFPEIAAAYLFGSAARECLRPDSDLDVGVVLRERGARDREHHRTLAALAAEVERAWPGHPVDVVLLPPRGPAFCHRVLVEGRLAYEADRERRIDFESDTYSRYLDWQPTEELAAPHVLEGLRRRLERRP